MSSFCVLATGRCWSEERRRRLLDLASRHDVVVIEDAPYAELRYSGQAAPSIASLDRAGMVVYLGTFSKTFCPGLRIGWLTGPRAIFEKCVLVKQGADLHTSDFSQRIIARYYDLSHVAASAIGVVCGLVMAGVVYQFAKLLYAQQASSHLHLNRLIGASGEVSVSIPPGGVGQITISAGGERTEHIARTADGQAIARGVTVTITGLGGDSVIVAPVVRS